MACTCTSPNTGLAHAIDRVAPMARHACKTCSNMLRQSTQRSIIQFAPCFRRQWQHTPSNEIDHARCWLAPASFGLNARCPNHAAPFLRFGCLKLGQRLGRRKRCFAARGLAVGHHRFGVRGWPARHSAAACRWSVSCFGAASLPYSLSCAVNSAWADSEVADHTGNGYAQITACLS